MNLLNRWQMTLGMPEVSMLNRKSGAQVVMTFVAAFVLQDCAGMLRSDARMIPVTSTPAGAKIFVDGRPAGVAPTRVRLLRSADHEIRIEKPGYNPAIIRVVQGPAPAMGAALGYDVVAGLVIGGILGAVGGYALTPQSSDSTTLPLLGMLAGAGALSVIIASEDAKSGRLSDLSPRVIDVTLTPVGRGEPRPVITKVAASELVEARWIRVTCPER